MELRPEEQTEFELLQALDRATRAELRVKELEFLNRLALRLGIPANVITFTPGGHILDSRMMQRTQSDAPAPEPETPEPNGLVAVETPE